MDKVIKWLDEVDEYPYRYQETDYGGGVKDIVPKPGTVIQHGTPQSATNFNHMELNGIQGILLGLLTAQQSHQLAQKVEGLEGEQIVVTMTNSSSYPFNNSKKSVQLSKNRNTKDYSIAVEILEKTGGGVGDIVISDKLLNGFKIEFTGAATSVKVNCIIRGGI